VMSLLHFFEILARRIMFQGSVIVSLANFSCSEDSWPLGRIGLYV
jgi:hypothetical protein